MVKELIRKYLWLIDTVAKASPEGLSLQEICRKWERRWDSPYNRRTFCNHRQAIEEIFETEILCDRTTNRYYLRDDDYGNSSTRTSWLINTFTVNNLLSLGRDKLSGRVSVEDIPSGQKWLLPLMDAMTVNEELELTHRKYMAGEETKRIVLPYALKEFEKRWYLVAWDKERQALRMYGLDRITGVYPTGKSFTIPDDFDVDVLFRNSFGAYISEHKDLRHIVLKATEKEAAYLRDLPLHQSQKEVSPRVFSLDAAIGEDLVLELIKRGNRIEILEPQDLRERIAEEFEKAAALYGKNKD